MDCVLQDATTIDKGGYTKAGFIPLWSCYSINGFPLCQRASSFIQELSIIEEVMSCKNDVMPKEFSQCCRLYDIRARTAFQYLTCRVILILSLSDEEDTVTTAFENDTKNTLNQNL